MKKLISIVCVVLVVFCMINVFENKPQALFVADDAFIVSVIGSVLLSIALSEGIALATGGESVYTGVANALWDYFVTGEAGGDVNEAIQKIKLMGSFVYQGGKFYFALNQNGYNFFRSWLQGIDFSQIHLDSNVTVTSGDFISNWTSNSLSSLNGNYAVGSAVTPLTINHLGYTGTFLSDRLVLQLNNDGTCFYRNNITIPSGVLSLVLLPVNKGCELTLRRGTDSGGNNSATPDFYGNSISYISNYSYSYMTYNGEIALLEVVEYYPGFRISLNGTLIAYSSNKYYNDYWKACLTSGSLLINQPNNDYPVNSNSSFTSVSVPAEFEEVAPAIPNNTGIGRNQIALIPVPGNTVDAQDESIVLSPGQVKDYDKEGEDYTFIPVPGQLQGKTGADLGVAIMNKTTFEETSTPVYTGSVPDVFPTAAPDVTITAGADVFPTVAPTEAPTAGEGSTADAIAGDIADIKDEVGDLSTPLTPPQAQDGTNKLKIPQLLLTKFPFCIPYDFYNAINQFNAEAEMPSFDIPFHFAQINFDYTMHIDFERFTTLAKICQWFFSVSWVVILILLTRKVIWK